MLFSCGRLQGNLQITQLFETPHFKKNLWMTMKKSLVCLTTLLLAAAGTHATPLFTDNFTYPDGNLVGNGGWSQTGTSTANPIQVANGKVNIGVTGQDVYNANIAGGPVTLTDGQSLFIGADINLSAAGTGDYFLHYTPTAGNTGSLQDRLYAKSSGTGYVLGWAASSSGVAYGSTVLNYNTTYHVVVAYNVVTGTGNDTGAIYVDPTDLVNPSGNIAYFSGGFAGGTENDTIAGINFRQGTSGSAPNVLLDNLGVSLTFSDVSAVPEPSSFALLGGFGILAMVISRRRR
jgi:hypothetical protein